MPYPITVSLCLVNGKPGYDLTIHDELATVQDYIAAMENAIEILPLFLHRKKANKCADGFMPGKGYKPLFARLSGP